MNIFSPQRPQRATAAHERAVRHRIVAQLSEAVKAVQHEFRDTESAIPSCEATGELCRALEALFIHGLKDTFMEMVSQAISDSRPPEPNFWPLLLVITHRAVITQVTSLSQVRTEIGRCRAWLRTAVNDGLFTSYLAMVTADRRLLGYHYEKYALLRDRDQTEIVIRYLQGLEVLPFRLAVNSSLLNAWDEAPLELAGVYFRPRQAAGAVTQGQDVAAVLAEPAPPPAAPRTPPPDAQLPRPDRDTPTLIMNALEPDQAFDVIMRTTSVDDLTRQELTRAAGARQEPAPPDVTRRDLTRAGVPRADSTCSSEASSLAGEVAALTAAAPPPPPPPPPQETSYIDILQSYRAGSPRARSLMQTPDVQFMFGRSPGGDSPRAGSPEHHEADPEPAETDGEPRERAEEGAPPAEPEAGSEDEEDPDKQGRRWLTEIANEQGLNAQGYQCAGCPRFVGMIYGQPRVCRFDARYYCTDCHTGADLAPLPARMVHNWDFTRYPVARRSREALERFDADPCINISDANVSVYDVSADMERVRLLRVRLVFLNAFLATCRSAAGEELAARLAGRQHLYQHVHVYAPVDLREARVGSLAKTLQTVATFATEHVLSCSLCSQKGFVCEFCRDVRILYPFDLEGTRQCRACCGLYHAGCWRRGEPCPRCQRRRRRQQLRQLLEEPQLPDGADGDAVPAETQPGPTQTDVPVAPR